MSDVSMMSKSPVNPDNTDNMYAYRQNRISSNTRYRYSHIGIVESCDGKTVYTIEGNSRDVCRRKSYLVGSSLIYGSGLPNYSGI